MGRLSSWFNNVVNDIRDSLLRAFKNLGGFPRWFFWESIKFWFRFVGHGFLQLFDMLGLGPILRHFLAPFRRDKTFAGYFVGISVRFFWVLASLVVLTGFMVILIGLAVLFYAAPVFLIYYEPLYLPFYLLGIVIVYLIIKSRSFYWRQISKGYLPYPLRQEVWKRLELKPKEAEEAFAAGKEELGIFLRKRGLHYEDYRSTYNWILRREYRKQRWKFWRDEFFLRRRAVDIGWISGFLPLLKRTSIDLTQSAAEGHLPHVYGRERELSKMARVLARPGSNNVLLIGPAGVGKTSLVYGLAWLVMGGSVSDTDRRLRRMVKPLTGKRVLELHMTSLLASTEGRGRLEARFQEILNELRAGDVILFIPNLQTVVQAGLANYLAPLLKSTHFPLITTTTPRTLKDNLSGFTELISEFSRLTIEPPGVVETVRILEGVVSDLEKKSKLYYTYPALHSAVELSERYIHDRVLPAKAVDVLVKAAEDASRRVISRPEVEKAIEQLSGVPVGELSAEETQKLLNLERLLDKQIVGQKAAIRGLARAMRRARAGVTDTERPIAAMLFLGPTGVGKTLTAKTLARVYFTPQSSGLYSEEELSRLVKENFVQFDMSEFSEHGKVDTFMDQVTEAVKEKPFSLILLDEFEKAEAHIHNLFLQVFEEGQLSDEYGEKVDFRNSIVIATSNALRRLPQDLNDDVRQEYIRNELEKYLRPELINRFDGVIVFRRLSRGQMEGVVELELNKLARRMEEEHEISLSWTEKLVRELARLGYDPEYGARPLRRLIQNRIGDALAQKLLRDELQFGDNYRLSVRDLQ